MRAVELGAHDDVIRRDAQKSANGCGALGEQCRDSAVQDAKGLVHVRTDFDAQDDFVG